MHSDQGDADLTSGAGHGGLMASRGPSDKAEAEHVTRDRCVTEECDGDLVLGDHWCHVPRHSQLSGHTETQGALMT